MLDTDRLDPGVREPVAGKGASDVKVCHLLRMADDEVFPDLNVFSHQCLEDLIGFHRILDIYLPEDPVLGIHGGFPELVGVHLTQTLVALDRNALSPNAADTFCISSSVKTYFSSFPFATRKSGGWAI